MDDSVAYWGGLAVSAVMLGSGFFLLFMPGYVGYGAVILSLGVMTMILVVMTKALTTQIQRWMDYNARIEETLSNVLALTNQNVPNRSRVKPKSEPATAENEEEETEVAVAAS